MNYTVNYLRSLGFEAKWAKIGGRPILMARNPLAKHLHQRTTWWVIDNQMWEMAKEIGFPAAFDNSTLLGDLFNMPA